MKNILFYIIFLSLVFSGCNSSPEAINVNNPIEKDSLEFVINISQKVKPEHISNYKIAFEKCRTETLKEDGCLVYDLFISDKDSTQSHLYEKWTDKSKQSAHTKTPHFKEFIESTKGVFDGKKSIVESYVIPK